MSRIEKMGHHGGDFRCRRLTLAPCSKFHAAAGEQEGDESLHAGSGDVGTSSVDGDWSDTELQRRHGDFFLGSVADPLSGFRKARSGSRFWLLADGESSDEEEVVDSKMSPTSEGESVDGFVCDAVRAGFSVGELQRAEVLATDIVSPRFGSVGVVANVTHSRTLARRIVDAVAERRAPEIKPWRGPLPKPRPPSRMSLGDIWVKDLRAVGGLMREDGFWIP